MRFSRSSSVSSLSSTSSLDEQETVQIFVKNVAGNIIPLTLPTNTTISTLRSLLALRTNLPQSDLRLVFAGKHLDSSATLADAHIGSESTLHLALPLRGGMAKMPKCDYKKDDPQHKCKEKIQPIIGECGFCSGKFCSKHRLLESHNCTGLEDCKKESHERNANKLNSERTMAIKGV
ncbi:uncharacterized protein PV09_05932 [Verruconis gallopava]|uniref:Ubiquitin-like domain-containing protein n=1 Tax=Verruconis gallopava TaxID=253628 RepID=A0A0D1YQK4_9PEZI|nr:uncharacterized protein PV09_05932 [Verruconis gallopava]KIW02882.1 hypothetical protein PV09_05932 [Verruconis gallopava]